MNRIPVISLSLLLLTAISIMLDTGIAVQANTVSVQYIEKVTYSCIGGSAMCPKVYGLGVNHTLTVYVEYQVNMTNSSTVYARLLVNNTWVHDHVWLRVLGRELVENQGFASTNYVNIAPQEFGYTNSTHLVVNPPIAINFNPKPGEVVNGLYIARIGEPYSWHNGTDFSLKYFELYYDPATKIFLGGRLHFIYTEYVRKEGYPIIYGFYDVYAEIYPASGEPPWVIAGQGVHETSINTSTTPSGNTSSTQGPCECPTNLRPVIIVALVYTVILIAALLLCYSRRGA